MVNKIHSPIVIALDYPNAEQAYDMAETLGAERCRVKIGKELFTRSGPAFVEKLVDKGFDVFLDLKYHDIPNTVAKACEAAADLGVWMINVHALGGRNMLLAAREAVDKSAHKPLLIAVTMLTSLSNEDLYAMGLHGSLEDNVLRLARLAKAAKLDGLVCSPFEVAPIREAVGEDLVLVTPGIRPVDSAQDDQKRIMTPAEAMQAGSNYLVIGRPVTQAADPVAALTTIEQSLSV